MAHVPTPPTGEPEQPRRRQLLQALTVAIGGSAALQLAGGNALSNALAFTPRADLAAAGQLFDARQMAALRTLCDLVIPATDIPGAADMDTHGFIDRQLAVVHPAEDQDRARRVLAHLDEAAGATAWNDLPEARRLALLDALDRGLAPFSQAQRADFKFLKSLVLFGYFTSEAGASLALAFDPVPGGFSGDFPYAQVGKSWGPGGLY